MVPVMDFGLRTLYFVCGAVVSLRSAPMLAAVGGANMCQPSASQSRDDRNAHIPDAIVSMWCGGVEEQCLEIASGTRACFLTMSSQPVSLRLGFSGSP